MNSGLRSPFERLWRRLYAVLRPAPAAALDVVKPAQLGPPPDAPPPEDPGFLRLGEREPWARRLERLLDRLERDPDAEPGMHRANHATVARTLGGMGPDSDRIRAEAGARMVVNMSSLHVPDFCRDGYLNTYDLLAARAMQAGQAGQPRDAPRISRRRERVDQALPTDSIPARDIYFGAAELHGAGMRFYGDICLVLKPGAVPTSTLILDRNSFDVDRSPAADRIRALPTNEQHDARAKLLQAWSGTWGADLPAMTTVRMHALGETRARRWTAGHVGRTIVDDEDYIEVLRQGSFRASDVQEARISGADAALDAWIASRIGHVVPPRFEELVWRRRRNEAELALRDAGVPVRVVTHLGRARY